MSGTWTTVDQYIMKDNQEFRVEVRAYVVPPSRGSRNSYGVPMEPDVPAHADDYEIESITNVETDKEYDKESFTEEYGEVELDEERISERALEGLKEQAEQAKMDEAEMKRKQRRL